MRLFLLLFLNGVLLNSLCRGQEDRGSMLVGREFEVSGFDELGPVTVNLVEYSLEDGGASKWVLSQAGEAGVEVRSETALDVFKLGLNYIKEFEIDSNEFVSANQRNSSMLYREKGFLRVSAQAGKSQTVMVAFYASESQRKLGDFEELLVKVGDLSDDARLRRIMAIVERFREK